MKFGIIEKNLIFPIFCILSIKNHPNSEIKSQVGICLQTIGFQNIQFLSVPDNN